VLHESQHVAFWLDATGLFHVPQGNLIGPGFVGVSFASASQQEHAHIESGEFAWS